MGASFHHFLRITPDCMYFFSVLLFKWLEKDPSQEQSRVQDVMPVLGYGLLRGMIAGLNGRRAVPSKKMAFQSASVSDR